MVTAGAASSFRPAAGRGVLQLRQERREIRCVEQSLVAEFNRRELAKRIVTERHEHTVSQPDRLTTTPSLRFATPFLPIKPDGGELIYRRLMRLGYLVESSSPKHPSPFGCMPSLRRDAAGDPSSSEARRGAPGARGFDGSARPGRIAGMHPKSIQSRLWDLENPFRHTSRRSNQSTLQPTLDGHPTADRFDHLPEARIKQPAIGTLLVPNRRTTNAHSRIGKECANWLVSLINP